MAPEHGQRRRGAPFASPRRCSQVRKELRGLLGAFGMPELHALAQRYSTEAGQKSVGKTNTWAKESSQDTRRENPLPPPSAPVVSHLCPHRGLARAPPGHSGRGSPAARRERDPPEPRAGGAPVPVCAPLAPHPAPGYVSRPLCRAPARARVARGAVTLSPRRGLYRLQAAKPSATSGRCRGNRPLPPACVPHAGASSGADAQRGRTEQGGSAPALGTLGGRRRPRQAPMLWAGRGLIQRPQNQATAARPEIPALGNLSEQLTGRWAPSGSDKVRSRNRQQPASCLPRTRFPAPLKALSSANPRAAPARGARSRPLRTALVCSPAPGPFSPARRLFTGSTKCRIG